MSAIKATSQCHDVAVHALCDALTLSRATYYRYQETQGKTACDKPKSTPENGLSPKEQQAVLDLLHSERFVDKTPYDIYYTLLDEGLHLCSPRTIYRLLAAINENQDRRAQRSHRDAVKPELIATNANEVWSWDITKLLSVHRLVYYHLYVRYDEFIFGGTINHEERVRRTTMS